MALSRFGSLTGVRVIDSGTYYGKKLHAKPSYPHTQGLSFLSARYTSSFVSFQHIVLADREGRRLQTPTGAQALALREFDPSGSIPAVSIGGDYGLVCAPVSSARLAGLSAARIASELAKPASALAPYLDAQADVLSAALRVARDGRPASVCQAPGVRAAAVALPAPPAGETVPS